MRQEKETVSTMSKGFLTLCIPFALMLAGCSSGPSAPEPGTPAFYWSAANDNFGQGDYAKTDEQLQHLTNSDNDFTARAIPWDLVINAGLANGYIQLANAFDDGAHANKANEVPLHRQANVYRSMASRLAIGFGEEFPQFEQKSAKDANVSLAFQVPPGSIDESPLLKNASSGVLPSGGLDDLEKKALDRQVLLAICEAAGAPDDLNKARDLFKAGPVSIPRPVFLFAMSNNLFNMSKLFENEPDKLKFFLTRAQEALKSVPESKETKELDAKLQLAMKKKPK
jgi:hypothetical protein